jgi:hypothetical protein
LEEATRDRERRHTRKKTTKDDDDDDAELELVWTVKGSRRDERGRHRSPTRRRDT